ADTIHRDAEACRDALRDHGFRALALFADAGVTEDRAGAVEPHRRAVLRRDSRAADAVEGRRWVCDLDEASKANAAIDAFLAQRLLLGAEPRAVHHRIEMREGLVVR